jgi:hypothetical protein
VIVRLVLWSLGDSVTSVSELRRELRENDGAFAPTSGLLFRAWVADESTERFGAVDVLASRAAADEPLPPRARELIGKDPELAELFDVEATVSIAAELSRRGLAFDAPGE